MCTIIKMRLDKWLWAARFYKTRSLAKKMIEKGKIKVNGISVKASRDIKKGDSLLIYQEFQDKEIVIELLIEKRGTAKQAGALYTELPESIEKRALNLEKRKATMQGGLTTNRKPNKRERRNIEKWKRQLND